MMAAMLPTAFPNVPPIDSLEYGKRCAPAGIAPFPVALYQSRRDDYHALMERLPLPRRTGDEDSFIVPRLGLDVLCAARVERR